MSSNSRYCIVVLTLLSLSTGAAPQCRAGIFLFGSAAGNNLNGMESGSNSNGDFKMQLAAGPPGAQFNEVATNMLGILSREIPDVIDPSNDKFDILGGTSPLAGTSESMQFSFDKPGILTGINFDGVKDEALEYFILESTSGTRVNFFDSAANTTVSGAVDDAIAAGAVTGAVVYMLEINSVIDDEAQGLSIPFDAGEQFTLAYAELGSEFHPLQAGNGARLQGITVESVPEPSAMLLLLSAFAAAAASSPKRGRHF